MPSQPSSTSTATRASQNGAAKGIGPHFKDDAAALTYVYQNHGLTHDEWRENLATIGVKLQPWPEGVPKPYVYKLWVDIDDLDDDAVEPMALSLVPPPAITTSTDEALPSLDETETNQ